MRLVFVVCVGSASFFVMVCICFVWMVCVSSVLFCVWFLMLSSVVLFCVIMGLFRVLLCLFRVVLCGALLCVVLVLCRSTHVIIPCFLKCSVLVCLHLCVICIPTVLFTVPSVLFDLVMLVVCLFVCSLLLYLVMFCIGPVLFSVSLYRFVSFP